VQGALKVDWVTEWFPASNWKLTVSPTAAVMELLVKASTPPVATSTTILAALTAQIAESRVVIAKERIFVRLINEDFCERSSRD